MKKCLIWTILGTLSLCIVVPTNAFTESEVTAKVEQLEKVIKTTLKKPGNRSKYSPLFKSTFESCAKTCKDEVNKEASLRLGKKYYSNFLEENTPTVKSDMKIENTATTNDIQKGENHRDIVVNTSSEEEKTTNTQTKCYSKVGGPDGLTVKRGSSNEMRYSLYDGSDIKRTIYDYSDGTKKTTDKVYICGNGGDKYTYKIKICAESDASLNGYELLAESSCGYSTSFDVNIE